MDTKEALQSFDLDPRLLYDAIAFSTDDYLYIIDMKTDTAVVSENMLHDFNCPTACLRDSSPAGANT